MWILPYAAIAALVILADQVSKLLILNNLYQGQLDLIPGIFRFTYVENRGMAFGLLSDQRWVFMILSVIGISLVGVYLYLFVKTPTGRVALGMIIGGGIGNMIDRIRLGFVVDFIDFYAFPSLWAWVFNVADAAVCVGAALFILDLLIDTVKELKKRRTAQSPKEPQPTTKAPDGDVPITEEPPSAPLATTAPTAESAAPEEGDNA